MPTNGFNFGQSQSFPGASQPTNGTSSAFSFGGGAGGGGGASSFNFSAAPSSNNNRNPFAGIGTASQNQPADGDGFSGFKGSIFNLPPAGNQSPAQQPLPSGGIFGNAATSAPSTSATPATGAGLFGTNASSPAPSPAPTNLFGPSSPDKPTAFGQSLSSGDDSMQTSPDAKSSTASKPSIFTNGTAAGPPPVFGGVGGSNLFSTTSPATGQSPSKPLFGEKPAEQSPPATPSLFGASTQTSAPTTTPTAAPSNLFGAASPAKPASDAPAQNAFQSSNLFSGVPTSSSNPFKPAQEKGQDEAKPAESSPPKSPFQFTASTTNGPSLFSKSESTAAPGAGGGGLFGAQSSLGASRPPSAGNLFAPKPDASQTASPSKPEQQKQQAPAQNPFGSLFSPKPAANPAEQAKPATFAPSLSASTPPEGAAKPPSAIQQPASVFQQATASQNGFNTNASEPAQRLETMKPKGLSAGLSEFLKDDVELLNRVRILNDSFKREITKLDPIKDDFDLVILYYVRVRETIGAPTGGDRQPKRRPRDEEGATDKDASSLKVKPFGEKDSSQAGTGIAPSASQMNIAPSSITSSPTKLFGANEAPKSSNKRKADNEDEGTTSPAAKRTHGDSATASIFAKTFSNTKSPESEEGSGKADTAFKPATPESTKVTPKSTTPTTSPAKTLFAPPAASKEFSTSSAPLFGQPASTSKSGFTPSASNAAPANPFAPKLPENKNGDAGTAAPFAIPKFGGGGGGGTNFFAQFKTQADKHAEKEKEKRKEEDYDSEEDDEAEWERKDAEKQRQKREELASQTQKRAKFVPGKGFVFEDGSSAEGSAEKAEEKAEEPAASDASLATSASVFDKKLQSPEKSSNIFGHLSATPTEVEENDGDTDEASAAGDEPEPRAATTSAESAANDSSEDGDFGKALEKSKKAAKPATGADSTSGSDTAPATPNSSAGRSMFGPVQQDGEDKSKSEDGGDSSAGKTNPFASIFSTPKPAPPSGSGLFQSTTSTSGSTGLFGSGSGSFGSTGLATSSGSTGSIFGATSSAIKPSNDRTWKMNSPIKFSTDTPKSELGSGTSTGAEAPKPFSALFGAPPAGSASSTSGSQPSLGFSFGAPSQQSSSVFSSAPTSANTSGTSAPDSGANEPADGEASEALPQVDLARSGAGEENEDCLLETRARGLKLKPKEGWDSQGVGFIRILKNRDTSRSRVLLRADPSGKVVLNAILMKQINYSVNGTSVQFTVPQADGSLEQWAVRVKKEDVERLGSTMEEAKT